MPSGRDSFRRNRVAPTGMIIASPMEQELGMRLGLRTASS